MENGICLVRKDAFGDSGLLIWTRRKIVGVILQFIIANRYPAANDSVWWVKFGKKIKIVVDNLFFFVDELGAYLVKMGVLVMLSYWLESEPFDLNQMLFPCELTEGVVNLV